MPLKVAKYGISLRRLEEYTNYRNRKEILQRQIRNERRYVVPLKPQKIEILVKQLQRHGRITSNPFEKPQVQLTLHQLERMWEESNAFCETDISDAQMFF